MKAAHAQFSQERLFSIDAFRALTMLLMIWVNDFWSLTQVPKWLQHATADEDYLGFSDVIFPAFLFIVGLSIPFAIQKRRLRSETTNAILLHIGSRTFALLSMGIFMVNLETMQDRNMIISKLWWQVLMIISFFLIWNHYSSLRTNPRTLILLKILGFILLAFLAVTYQGASEPTAWMKLHWWGILGLIGWGYLICSVIFLFGKLRWPIMLIAWIFFAAFNLAEASGILTQLNSVRSFVWIIGSGSIPALTMAGVFVSTLYLQKFSEKNLSRFFLMLLGTGLMVLTIGILERPFGGISKIHSTPSWTEICTGISILCYAVLFWLVDMRGKNTWLNGIEPAGSVTLTCYLVPYLVYPALILIGIQLPTMLTSGTLGLISALVFALMIVWITGLLNKLGIRLKI